MTDKTEESLRREVLEAARNEGPASFNVALDALRDHYQARPTPCDQHPRCPDNQVCDYCQARTFEGDEAEVRVNGGVYTIAQIRDWLNPGRWDSNYNAFRAEATLALLDAKDAERDAAAASWQEAEDLARHLKHERDEALAAKERAEQALAERDAAIMEAVRRTELNLCGDLWAAVRASNLEPLRRFILPAKLSDPLVEVWQTAWPGTPLENAVEEAANLRAAIERAGGTIEFPDALLAQRSKTNG